MFNSKLFELSNVPFLIKTAKYHLQYVFTLLTFPNFRTRKRDIKRNLVIEFLVVANKHIDADSLSLGLQGTLNNVNKSSYVRDIPVTALILNGSVAAIPGIIADTN